MTTMNRFFLVVSLVFASALAFAVPPCAAQAGSIEFSARITPSGGVEEPVRGFPVYLLRKSFEDIKLEADAAYPKPDMNAFIDKLEVSKELKAWMKTNKTVRLNGQDFTALVKPADIMAVKEFYSAYMDRNSDDQTLMGFPKPKWKASDKVKDPAKYEKLDAEYRDAIKKFIEQNPQTIDGLDLALTDTDPSQKWDDLVAKRQPQLERATLDLARGKYYAARADTDLQGLGGFRNVQPGYYWLSSLDVPATVGDAQFRWDVAITVAPGQTLSVVLDNSDAAIPVSPRATH
ncbi:MAG: hypothetical protein WA875_04485 [Candidatus Acidiferrales bacterium]